MVTHGDDINDVKQIEGRMKGIEEALLYGTMLSSNDHPVHGSHCSLSRVNNSR